MSAVTGWVNLPVVLDEAVEPAGSCHDSTNAQSHFQVQSFLGQESCSVCHGKGREFSVEVSHKLH